MTFKSVRFILLALIAFSSQETVAQTNSEALRDDLLQHFNTSSSKVIDLSKAIPASLFDWAPGAGVMSVANVYAHIARYNYMYLAENLGIPAPAGVDYEKMEDLTNKEDIVAALVASVRHARTAIAAMNSDALTRETTLYGRKVESWSVVVQLVAHLNEHTGQSVAYARMNGVVPPWSM
jgi:uncharacterized damage-inducible protein DinB